MGEERASNPVYTDEDWDRGRAVPGAMEWLKEHWDEYTGKWVAIGPYGRLVAQGDTFDEMRQQLPTTRCVLITQVI